MTMTQTERKNTVRDLQNMNSRQLRNELNRSIYYVVNGAINNSDPIAMEVHVDHLQVVRGFIAAQRMGAKMVKTTLSTLPKVLRETWQLGIVKSQPMFAAL